MKLDNNKRQFRPSGMSTQKKLIIAACVVVALLAAGSTAYYLKYRSPDPAKMTSEQIQKYMQSPDYNSLPREQRRDFFEKVMDSRVQGYFNTPTQDRDKYLDKIIDDMQKMRQSRPNFDSQRPRPDANMIAQFQQRRNSTPEQRRLRTEMQDPVKNAMRRQFMGAMMNRAAQRGIQMGGFGGRGGGGPRG